MGLYIRLSKRNEENLDFYRFKSAFCIFNDFFMSLKKQNIKIAFYKDFPIPELNLDSPQIDFDFGILESSFRGKIKELKNKGLSIKAGFELEFDLVIDDKKFRVVFDLLPRYRSKYYDIKIDILSNGYGDIFEDLEKFSKELRLMISNRILEYNKQAQKKENNIFIIKRAIMSDYKKEFHNIGDWRFFYSKEPEEFINYLSYGDKELRERFSFANRQKFAQVLNNLNEFVYKLFEYAKESQVQIKEGSLVVIPKDENSMKEFIGKMKNKIYLVAKETYPTKKELNDKLQKVFAD